MPKFVAHYPAALKAKVLAVRPAITDPASLAHIVEATLLAGAADPERAYIERILPAKLALQADYAARRHTAHLVTFDRDVARLLDRHEYTLLMPRH